MTPERWNKIKALFSSAQDCPVAERDAFLNVACMGDEDLKRDVEKLLASHDENDKFLQNSAVEEAANLFSPGDSPEDEWGALATPQFDPGTLLKERYKILRLLGRGGMGEVYLADDTRIRRNVALKVLHTELVSSKDSLRRFALEAQAVSALNHPNIVTIYEFDTASDGTLFFVSEYVEGQTLNHTIGADLELERALDIAIQVSSALSAAHAAGIIHRDVKPENIMVRPDGYIKVLDFGLAKLNQHEASRLGSGSEDPTKALERTRPGVVMGTAAYMSPEQARGKDVDARTDIWSLGVVLYEMLTRHRPFSGETPADIVVSVLSTEPKPIASLVPSLPAELDWMVTKALSKDLEGRYQTAKGLRADLERIRKKIEFERSAGHNIQEENTVKTAAEPGAPTAGEAARPTNAGHEADGKAQPFWSSSGLASFVQQSQTHKFVALLLILLLTGFAAFAVYYSVGSGPKSAIDSIAVLPFENPAGDPDLTYAADGISENLIDRLAQIAQVKVISRNSSFKFRGNAIDVRAAASQLGVRAIVTGSVVRLGDELAVRFDIVDVAEDRHLAGGQFKNRSDELPKIQNEIAARAVELLHLRLSDTQARKVADNGTANSDANRYYLSGLVEMNGPDNSRERALEYFGKAVALDPTLAEAHVEIAWIYWWRANGSDDPATIMPKAVAATKRALEIDPELSKAHALQGMMYEYEFNWQAAENEYRRAIELSPNLDFNRNNYAFFLSVLGRQEEALAQLEQQRLRDPINRRLALLQKAIILTQGRNFDEALGAYREAQAVEPTQPVPDFALGYAYGGKGLHREAAEYYYRAVTELGGTEKYSQPLVYLAAAYAKMPQKRGEARAILSRVESTGGFASPALRAMVHSALGDSDKAMELLERAYIEKDLLLRYVGVAYEYDQLRSDPRFIDLLRRCSLPNG